MHLLARLIIISVFIFSAGCGSGGPITPEDSFSVIKEAIRSNDIKIIGEHICSSSRVKVENFRIILSRLDNAQLRTLSEFYNYDAERLKNIDFNSALSLYFRGDGKNTLRDLFSRDIIAVDILGKKAVLRLDNGVELDFKKEGPYWKFDFSDL